MCLPREEDVTPEIKRRNKLLEAVCLRIISDGTDVGVYAPQRRNASGQAGKRVGALCGVAVRLVPAAWSTDLPTDATGPHVIRNGVSDRQDPSERVAAIRIGVKSAPTIVLVFGVLSVIEAVLILKVVRSRHTQGRRALTVSHVSIMHRIIGFPCDTVSSTAKARPFLDLP
jgi:hypothetical protein